MGSIKDRNGMEYLTEGEDIKKNWQEYTEELYKKDLNDPDNNKGVITHTEPDILGSEVKWTVAHQAPPSKGFSRQEYWSGSPFPSPGDLPDPGIEPKSPTL